MSYSKYVRWFIEFVCVTVISAILALKSFSYLWLILPIVVIILVKYFEYESETNEIYQKVHSQLKLIYRFCAFSNEADVRCVFHAPIWFNRLLQTTGYIMTGSGKGRIFYAKKGIIGKSYTQKMSFTENFSSDEEYREKMKSVYGYNENEIRLRATDRRSYLCLPFINDANQRVIGLVYFDSCIPNFFANIEDPRIKEIRAMLRMVRDSLV